MCAGIDKCDITLSQQVYFPAFPLKYVRMLFEGCYREEEHLICAAGKRMNLVVGCWPTTKEVRISNIMGDLEEGPKN